MYDVDVSADFVAVDILEYFVESSDIVNEDNVFPVDNVIKVFLEPIV